MGFAAGEHAMKAKGTPRSNLKKLWREIIVVDAAYLQGDRDAIKVSLRSIITLGQEMLEQVEKLP